MRIWILFMVIGISSVLLWCGCSSEPVTGGRIDTEHLVDGVFTGEFSNGPVHVVVKVHIEDRGIAHVELVEHRNWRGEKAEKDVIRRIVMQQSTSVDAVSGATMSSVAIMNAVQAAVEKSQAEGRALTEPVP